MRRFFITLARRLRPTHEDFAAAAGWQDPGPLLRLYAQR
jgi:hypothetical protein